VANTAPDLRNDSGELVSRHMRQLDVIVPGPRVPVTTAEAGRSHLDDDASIRCCRLGHIHDLERTSEPTHQHRAHGGAP
jgi:hypothetical protein